MPTLLAIVAVVACMAFVAWRAQRQVTLFVIRVRDGKIEHIKGRIPRRLLTDIADVVERGKFLDLRIVCRSVDGRPHVALYGTGASHIDQVLRNLVGEYPIARLRQAPRA